MRVSALRRRQVWRISNLPPEPAIFAGNFVDSGFEDLEDGAITAESLDHVYFDRYLYDERRSLSNPK